MKDIFKKAVLLAVIIILYLSSSFFLGGLPIGFNKGRLMILKRTCADMCFVGDFYVRYYGKISYDECISLNGKPRLVGFIMNGPDGKPGRGSIGGYDGCEVRLFND